MHILGVDDNTRSLQQPEALECGAASLAMVMASRYGPSAAHTRVSERRGYFPVSSIGISITSLSLTASGESTPA